MNVLVLGGTRFFGVHMVKSLLAQGHEVTIATRGKATDPFGDEVRRVIIERSDAISLKNAFGGKHYEAIIDNLAYSSNDVRFLLDNVGCDRYIMTSSASVYEAWHLNIKEQEFDPNKHILSWSNREEYSYNEGKRQAETALFQHYPELSKVALRIPYVIGLDDYTKRLYFYLEQVIKGEAIYIDNLDEQIGFISSDEAGQFLVWIAEQTFTGPINGNSGGTISLGEVLSYVESTTGIAAKLDKKGLNGSYNGAPSFSLDTTRATSLGYNFTDLKPWIFQLLDSMIHLISAALRV